MSMRLCSYSFALILLFLAVGCSRSRSQQSLFESGTGGCSNLNLGDFSLELKRSAKYRGYYDLSIYVNEATNPGQTVHVLLANPELNYIELPAKSGLQSGKTLFQGPISYEEVVSYPLVVIAPRKGYSGSPLQSLSEDDEAVCKVPRTDNSGGTSNGSTIE